MGQIEVRRQFLATFCGMSGSTHVVEKDFLMAEYLIRILCVAANLMGLSFGVTMVWAPANFLVLQSNETKLPSGPLTVEEAVIVASVFAIGGLAGNMSYLWIVERFGRKLPLLLLAIPQMVRIPYATRAI